jgi:hypothetical protein
MFVVFIYLIFVPDIINTCNMTYIHSVSDNEMLLYSFNLTFSYTQPDECLLKAENCECTWGLFVCFWWGLSALQS